MRHKLLRIVSLITLAAIVLPLTSCAFASSLIYGKYKLSGDSSESKARFADDVLTLGQKGSGKCIEAFTIDINSPDGKDISIAYRSHIQDAGWYDWAPGGQEITYAQYYGIDTIQFMLMGKDAGMFDIEYRIAVVGEDWQEWVSNGTIAGIPEVHRPIEAVEIKLVQNDSYVPAAWTITEFDDVQGNQGMFYTMRNNEDGTLIVVDGGHAENTTQVRSVINLMGGRVDHWFLTHYDEDHACVFNEIYADPDGIEIGEVYATPLDYDYYMTFAVERWWDTPWVYEQFLSQTEGDERIHYLARDDVFEIDGLTVEVFNSYDDIVIGTGSPDVANFASLVFKISGQEDSILFCGDVYGQLWVLLTEMYGDRLAARYVQPGHHGNNHVDSEYWSVVNADVMFFDGPSWLTTSDDHDAKRLIEWCHSNGIETYEFATAPNWVAFN
ncbi:MAG: hypothetical protein K6F79_08850 [Saccharofermentans sp.]|nr:hypothetical protein [Saccharofermentans sp.]